jgi:3D (Asp-Asp-Asp) domain-containing protein
LNYLKKCFAVSMVLAAFLFFMAPSSHAQYDITVEATAYNAYESNSPCADGSPCIPYRTIAVDPNVIPLGTRVYVPGFGEMVAHDTGGAIQGHIIDIAMDSDDSCYNWGRKTITITILD